GDLHTGSTAAHPRLMQAQPGRLHAIVLLPADLLDAVLPGQGEAGHRQLGPDHPRQAQAELHHAECRARRARHRCWMTNSSPRPKASSTVTRRTRIISAPASRPSGASHQSRRWARETVNTIPQRPIAKPALHSMYSVAQRSPPCIISAGLYTAMKGTTKPATAMRMAHRLIFRPLSRAIGAAAKQARATGGVRSAMMPK